MKALAGFSPVSLVIVSNVGFKLAEALLVLTITYNVKRRIFDRRHYKT